MRLCYSLLLAASAAAFQPPALPETGALEGRVLDLGSGEPIPGARVTLTPIPIVMGIRPTGGPMSDSFYDPSQMPAKRVGTATILTTDLRGDFRTALAPGRYQVHAMREGYVPAPAGLKIGRAHV